MDSPLYSALLEAAADDIADGGVIGTLVADWSGDPRNDALPLRVLGATHLLALDGRAPALAEHYPSAGGRPRGTVAAVFLRTVAEHFDEIRSRLRYPPQTNEVGRSAIVFGGLLELTALLGSPIRLFEVGASAGLNLNLDRFHYALGDIESGEPGSSVKIESRWTGLLPNTTHLLDVSERRGCDTSPLDVSNDADMLRLQSYVWPDQIDRLTRMRSAIALTRRHPVEVESAHAADWVSTSVAPRSGDVTVLMHTVVMQYIDAEGRKEFNTSVRTLASNAARDAPLAWLRFEPGQDAFELRLSVYPHGLELLLAEAQPHGRWVKWLPR